MSHLDRIVADVTARAIAAAPGKGVLVLVWDKTDTSYQSNVKPPLVPAVLRALADKLAPIQKDGSSTVLVQPDGQKVVVPPDPQARAAAAEQAAEDAAMREAEAEAEPKLHP